MIKSQQGFTLIEVMIVIAIVAIIASIAAPRFQDTLQSQNLNAEAKELILLLNTARSQALTLRQEANVNINSDSTDSGFNFNLLPEEKNKIVEKNTKFTITFLPNGTVKDFNTSLTSMSLCNSALKKSKRILISRTGNVSMLTDGTCT